MRVAPTLVLSSLATVLVPLVSAHSPHSSPSRSIARLQHHQPRLLDICVNISKLVVDLLGPLGLLGLTTSGNPNPGDTASVQASVCLCIKDLDIYLKAHANADLQNQALAIVNAALGDASENAQCDPLPAHAKRVCSTSDPCGFTCDAGFEEQGKQCVCMRTGCGASAAARSLKSRRSQITTLEEAKAYCRSSAVCGVPDSPTGWECLDVTRDLHSWGGCMPHPFQPRAPAPSVDRDLIPNALSGHVSCKGGKCVVKRCEEGYTVSAAGDKCIRIGEKSSRQLTIDIGGDSAASTPATSASTPVANAANAIAGVVSGAKALTTAPDSGCVNKSTVLLSLIVVLGSSDKGNFLVNVNLAIAKVKDALNTAMQCGSAGGDLGKTLGDLLSHLITLQIGGVPTDVDHCLVVDTRHVVYSILPGVCLGPVVVCGAVGKLLNELLQHLIDGLGLGLAPPPASCPAAVPPPSTSASSFASSPSPPTPSSSSASSPSPPTPSSSSASSPASSDPVSSDPTTYLAILINIVVEITSTAGPSCGGLTDAVNDLFAKVKGIPAVNVLLAQLTGPVGLLSGLLGRDLLDLNVDLGGVGGGSGAGGVAASAAHSVASMVKSLPASRTAGGLGSLVNNLLDGLKKLVNELLGRCVIGPCPTGAIAAAPSASLPAASAMVSASVSRRTFRTRSGHFVRTSSSDMMAPGLIPSMVSVFTYTAAITTMKSSLPSGAPSCDPLLTSLTALISSASSITFHAHLFVSVSAAKVYLESLIQSGWVDRPDLLFKTSIGQLLDVLINMRDTKSLAVSRSTLCPSADATLPVCALGFTISEWMHCSIGSQALPENTAKLLGTTPKPAKCLFSSVPAATPRAKTSLPTRADPFAALLPLDSTQKFVSAANAVLALCLKINLEGGNLPFRKAEVVLEVNAYINVLLVYCVGPSLVQKGTDGKLGGAVADVLSGGKPNLVNLKVLVDNLLAQLKLARGDSSCGCDRTVDNIIAYLNQLVSAYTAFKSAADSCGCGSSTLLSGVSGLLNENHIKAFELLQA